MTINVRYIEKLTIFTSFLDKIRYDYSEQICPNCNSCLESVASENPSKDKEEEEKIAMNYLLRLMIASSKLGSALKRIEYRM